MDIEHVEGQREGQQRRTTVIALRFVGRPGNAQTHVAQSTGLTVVDSDVHALH